MTVVMMLCLLLGLGRSVDAGFRKEENGRYRYYTSETTYLKGISGGALEKSWIFKNLKSNGKVYTYAFDADGYMLTGWQKLYTTVKNEKAGWFYYYFDRNGRMYKDRTKNGHYLQKNGRMLTQGWHNGTYYNKAGEAVKDYQADVKQGFKKTKKGIKYLLPDGTYAAKTWLAIKDSTGRYYWYYFYGNGYLAKDTIIGGRYVDKNGRWQG